MSSTKPTNNTLVFVSQGEKVEMFKVSDRPVDSPIEFNMAKTTVLTEEGKDVPAVDYEDFNNIRPFLKRTN